eukprot:COSAG02_NODE_2698_length_8208_cov_10.377482_2_plen_100_part_00
MAIADVDVALLNRSKTLHVSMIVLYIVVSVRLATIAPSKSFWGAIFLSMFTFLVGTVAEQLFVPGGTAAEVAARVGKAVVAWLLSCITGCMLFFIGVRG